MNAEQWARIPGFPDYEASTWGRLRSWRTHRGQPGPRILKPSPDSKGYLTTALWNDAGRRTIKVHTYIALAFLGPRPEGQEVRHLDGDNQNNLLGNLVYGTPAQNMQDRVRHKTHCKQGHPFNEQNTRLRPTGARVCRTCEAISDRKRRPRRKAAA